MVNMRIGDDEANQGYESLFENMQQVVSEDSGVIKACINRLKNGLPRIVIGRNEPGTQHFITSIQAASKP